jgi:ATP-dependent Clp protease ATP-binding subunit ClpA
MRLLARSRAGRPRARPLRPAERYLAAGADEARRHGCSFVGTEHVLLALVRDPASPIVPVLAGLDVDPPAVEAALAGWLRPVSGGAMIDPEALATLGIDFETVRGRLEQTFGPGALERTRASCLAVAPRLKRALAHAVDYADGRPLGDEHVLLGLLSVPDSVAARSLAGLNISLAGVKAALGLEARGRPDPPASDEASR